MFSYGVLRRPAWRDAILGAVYPARPATLHGYRRVATEAGYLTLRPAPGSSTPVVGVLIELDEIAWRVADAFEGTPEWYRRIEVEARDAAGPVAAMAYEEADPDVDGVPVPDDCLALLDDADVSAAIAEFGATMRAIRAGA